MAKKTTTKKTVTPSKKAAPKTSVKTRAQVQSHAVAKPKSVSKSTTKNVTKIEEPKKQTNTSSSTQKPMRVRKLYVGIVAAVLVLGAFLYVGRGLFVAAVVNGQPISRLSVVSESEKQSGKQALDTMVRNTLIEQEARKQNVTVSEKEIDDEIKKVEETLTKQGQKLDDVLAMQGMSRQDLRKLIKLDKLVTKIVGKDVKVTDAEVSEYLEKNKELLPQNQTEEQLKKTATEQVKQQKLNQEVRTWVESLQTKAKVMYFVQY